MNNECICNVFDSYLADSRDPQEWSDLRVLKATEMLDSFRDDDFKILLRQWLDRSAQWQGHLADALSGVDSHLAIPVLLEILEQTPHDSVALMAADSLRVLLRGRELRVTRNSFLRLEKMQYASQGLSRKSLDLLMESIRPE
jgi:hypothetical protein